MNGLMSQFDVGVNFWEIEPQFKVAGPFKELYTNDKSKKKIDSSMTMWFVALCYDRNSRYYKMPPEGPEGKHAVIGEDFCGSTTFYKDNKMVLDMCIDFYIKMQYTPMERHLKTWEDLLNKRTVFLASQEYDFDTYDKLDKMAVGTKLVEATIKGILKDMEKEEGTGNVKGGARTSISD